MHIKVPIRYQSSGNRGGASTNATLWFQEYVDVDVPELEDDDAPVGLRWNDAPPRLNRRDTSPRMVWPGGEEAHVRFDGENYWRPISCMEASGLARGEAVNAYEFMEAVLKGSHKTGFPLVELSGKRFGRDDEYFAEVTVSDRAAAIKAAFAAAESLLVVDGAVYRRCLEPMVVSSMESYSVDIDGRRTAVSGKEIRIVTDMPTTKRHSRLDIYPVHRIEDALAKSRRENATNRQTKAVLNASNATVIVELVSDYFRDGEYAAVAECRMKLRQFLSIMETERDTLLPFSERDKTRLILDMADALDAMPSEEAIDAFETLGARYLAEYGEARGWNFPEQRILREALSAAAARTIQIDPVTERSLSSPRP